MRERVRGYFTTPLTRFARWSLLNTLSQRGEGEFFAVVALAA